MVQDNRILQLLLILAIVGVGVYIGQMQRDKRIEISEDRLQADSAKIAGIQDSFMQLPGFTIYDIQHPNATCQATSKNFTQKRVCEVRSTIVLTAPSSVPLDKLGDTLAGGLTRHNFSLIDTIDRQPNVRDLTTSLEQSKTWRDTFSRRDVTLHEDWVAKQEPGANAISLTITASAPAGNLSIFEGKAGEMTSSLSEDQTDHNYVISIETSKLYDACRSSVIFPTCSTAPVIE